MSVTHFNFSEKMAIGICSVLNDWPSKFLYFQWPPAPLAAKFKRIGYFVLMAHANSIVLLGGTTNEGLFSTIFTLKRGVFFNCVVKLKFFSKELLLFLHLPIAFFGSHDCYLNNEIKLEELHYSLYTQSTDLRSVERNSFLAFFLNHK